MLILNLKISNVSSGLYPYSFIGIKSLFFYPSLHLTDILYYVIAPTLSFKLFYANSYIFAFNFVISSYDS